MQKFTIGAAGTKTVKVAPGATIYFAASGTYVATITVQYATEPGVFTEFATPVVLTGAGATKLQVAAINVGAHNELLINCSAYTSGTATIIANTQVVRERE